MSDESAGGVAKTFAEADAERFTDWLRETADADWTAATEHQFVRELGEGTLDDAVFERYLVQDYAFVRTLADAVGFAAGQAPTMEAKNQWATFLGTLTGTEDDFFERAFDSLGTQESERESPERTDTTAALEDLLVAASREGGYAETLAALLPAEWIYREWAAAVDPPTDPFFLREWTDLHDTAEFDAFVSWLRGQLDEEGPTLSPRRQRRVRDRFRRTVALEVAFFDAAYEESQPGVEPS